MYANDKPFHKTILIREYQGVEVKPHIEIYQKSIASPPFIPAFNMLTFPFIFLSRKKKFRRRVVASTPRSLCSLKHGIKYYKWILVHVENELEKEKAAKVSLADKHRSMQQVATAEKAFLKLDSAISSLGASGKKLSPSILSCFPF